MFDRVTEKKYNDAVAFKYQYDKSGSLYKKQDLLNNVIFSYQYDLIGRLFGITATNGSRLYYSYDNFNRVSKIKSGFGTSSLKTEYLYGDAANGQLNGIIYGVKQNDLDSLSYSYDKLARIKNRTLATTTPFVTEYTYLAGAQPNTTTTMLQSITNGSQLLSYSYDEVGNITEIRKNGTVYESYSYDSLNQLKTVTRGSDTWEYTYRTQGDGSVVLTIGLFSDIR